MAILLVNHMQAHKQCLQTHDVHGIQSYLLLALYVESIILIFTDQILHTGTMISVLDCEEPAHWERYNPTL